MQSITTHKEEKMTKLIQCKACEKEMAKSAKKCPHCGHSSKMKFWQKAILGIMAFGIIAYAMTPSKEEIQNEINLVANSQPLILNPIGEMAELFAPVSDRTDIQRQNKLDELKGKVVLFKLPVNDIRKSGDKYRISTQSLIPKTTKKILSIYGEIYPRNDAEKQRLESVSSGEYIQIQGRITGNTTMRKLELDPAILIL